MRISDWSSDVCSSDLLRQLAAIGPAHTQLVPLGHRQVTGHLVDGAATGLALAGEFAKPVLQRCRHLHPAPPGLRGGPAMLGKVVGNRGDNVAAVDPDVALAVTVEVRTRGG